jgi:hypothetical protein
MPGTPDEYSYTEREKSKFPQEPCSGSFLKKIEARAAERNYKLLNFLKGVCTDKEIEEAVQAFMKLLKAGQVDFKKFVRESLYGENGFYMDANINTLDGSSADFWTAMIDIRFLEAVVKYLTEEHNFSKILEVAGGSGQLSKYLQNAKGAEVEFISLEISPGLIAQQVPTVEEGGVVRSSHWGINRSVLDSNLNLSEIFTEPVAVFANELLDALPFHYLRENNEGELESCCLSSQGIDWQKVTAEHVDYKKIVGYYKFLKNRENLSFDIKKGFCFSPEVEMLIEQLSGLPSGSLVVLPDYYHVEKNKGDDSINVNPRFFKGGQCFDNLADEEIRSFLPLFFKNFDITYSPYLPYIEHLAEQKGFECEVINQQYFVDNFKREERAIRNRTQAVALFPPDFNDDIINENDIYVYKRPRLGDKESVRRSKKIAEFFERWLEKYKDDPKFYELVSYLAEKEGYWSNRDDLKIDHLKIDHSGFEVLVLRKK